MERISDVRSRWTERFYALRMSKRKSCTKRICCAFTYHTSGNQLRQTAFCSIIYPWTPWNVELLWFSSGFFLIKIINKLWLKYPNFGRTFDYSFEPALTCWILNLPSVRGYEIFGDLSLHWTIVYYNVQWQNSRNQELLSEANRKNISQYNFEFGQYFYATAFRDWLHSTASHIWEKKCKTRESGRKGAREKKQ